MLKGMQINTCCDMTPESRNSGVGAGRPLPSNGSENTFPLHIAANKSIP
jgi:hypothetical protein